MRQTKENTEQVKALILDMAAEEFSQKGYQGANLQQIAVAAGVSRGPLYYHFKDKRELFHATVEKLILEQKTEYDHILGQEKHILDILREEYTQCLSYSNSLLQTMCAQPELLEFEPYIAFEEWLYQRKLEVFTAAWKRGELRADCDPNELVTFLYIFYTGVLEMRRGRERGYQGLDARMMDHSVEAFLEFVKAKYL